MSTTSSRTSNRRSPRRPAEGLSLSPTTFGHRGVPRRIGIINLMPKAEEYEGRVLAPLLAADPGLEPVWLRLASHGYSSSDPARVASYRSLESAFSEGPLDGLVLTGAPVEELAFPDVHYFRELERLLRGAQGRVRSILGLCWGGLALAHLLGVPKLRYETKRFGVYAHRNLVPEDGLLRTSGAVFDCPQSRHSGIDDAVFERAEGRGTVRGLAHARDAGYTVFDADGGRLVMHLGHPEYAPERLAFEYLRDVNLGRADVLPPHRFDVDAKRDTWSVHRAGFFAGWVSSLTLPEESPGLPVRDSHPNGV